MTSPSPIPPVTTSTVTSDAQTRQTRSPLVSILINNYNYESYLPEALESTLNQTYPHVEVVVVDDGSTDQSCAVIERYCNLANEAIAPASQRIVPVFKPNGGQASAFNAGVAASRGEILCFLDADDYFAPEKISRIVEYFEQYPEAGWLFHELQEVDGEGKELPDGDRPILTKFASVDFRPALRQGDSLPYLPATSGLCFRRDTLLQLQAVPPAMRICADNFLRLASTCLAAGLLVPEKLAVHRMHGKNFYEQRTNISFMDAATDIKTSYYLRQQFPQAGPYADRLFSHAVGQLAGQDGIKKVFSVPESKPYLQQHFGLGNGLGCGLRIAYNYLKASRSLKASRAA